MREALARLRALEKASRERERELYGGKIQAVSVHQVEEAEEARHLARRAQAWRVVELLVLPLTLLWRLLLRVVEALRGALRGREKVE